MEPFHKVVVANRGDVARRVIKTLRKMNIQSVAVYSEADKDLPYLEEADEAYLIGDAPARASYLNQDAILKVIKETNADGVHPGYGFLAENADFASRIEAGTTKFIGPSPKWITAMSHKSNARELMEEHGMSTGKGSKVLKLEEEFRKYAKEIGFPVLVKPAAGGGGIGMLPVYSDENLMDVVERSKSLAQRAFSNDDVYLEKFIEEPRHIEFQILGDQHGNVQHLFERDCSIQRRHQKIIEETPAPGLKESEIDVIAKQIVKVLKEMGYDNIGTMEMLRGRDGAFSFLEMNTRLQVEHAVTEEVTGIDLVEAQILSASGEYLSNILPQDIKRNGHAIEARIYAEDPKTFFPSPGNLEVFRPPVLDGVRIETGYSEGSTVTPFYDPMVAKIIVHEKNRDKAILKLKEALNQFEIVGIKTNIPFLQYILNTEKFKSGSVHTGLVNLVSSK